MNFNNNYTGIFVYILSGDKSKSKSSCSDCKPNIL